jgi:carbamoyl-phosphate synthase large subunit
MWDALASGLDANELSKLTKWDPWFTRNLAHYQRTEQLGVRATKLPQGEPRYHCIDTSAGETKARTAFYYSTREKLGGSQSNPAPDLNAGSAGRVVILGSGPNRIGQGIEFDYCCVHASMALQRLGYEAIMVNCNPETVSTDPVVSTRLYLEPLAVDSVRAILERELRPVLNAGKKAYVLLQTGGQTPLKLASQIESWGFPILGTSCEAIDLAEDRASFAGLLRDIKARFPAFGMAKRLDEALAEAERIGYPILVRPSYVLGGRGMRVCSSERELTDGFAESLEAGEGQALYLDRFLNEAVEFDVDGICDGKEAWIAGVMEHVEEAGIHSGDSSCVLPPFRLPPAKIEEIAELCRRLAVGVGAKGFFNVQVAVQEGEIFVLEANPRASRTVPFLAKATGRPLVEWAMRVGLGERIRDLISEGGASWEYKLPDHGYAVKTPVFPFSKFRCIDPVLGPEMRSTGEVMGMARSAGVAFAKSFLAAGLRLPQGGSVLVSVRDIDKPRALPLLRLMRLLGFKLLGTPGTADYLTRAGVPCVRIEKIGQGDPDIISVLKGGEVGLVINTTSSLGSLRDSRNIRTEALRYHIPLLSTLSAVEMACLAIEELASTAARPLPLQQFVENPEVKITTGLSAQLHEDAQAAYHM